MRRIALLFCLIGSLAAQQPNTTPNFGPDSLKQPGVPEGKLTKHEFASSKIFPGTTRNYWVYVPVQYKPDSPAALMVFQDGEGVVNPTGSWRVPQVFDNLIHKGEIPVTIGVFIHHGMVPALSADQQNRYNRSYEYDGLSDRYVRFVLEELLPEVEKQFNITKDPNLRAIGGSSSGGIAAFTAAWHRPDAFRRVLSFIGSYVNLRGGDVWANLVRKSESKPLRIFLQDGSNDNDIYSGSWWQANQMLHASLVWAGYDTKFVTGEGAHNMQQGGTIMPDALRWLWADWKKPIAKPAMPTGRRYEPGNFLDTANDWQLVSEGHQFTEGPAVDKQGNVFFTDVPRSQIHRIDAATGKVALWKEDTGNANGLIFGPDGRLFACQNGRKRIVAYSMDGKESVIVDGTTCNDLTVATDGSLYYTDPPNKRVVYVDPQGKARTVHEGIGFPNGVTMSPDQALVMVADSNTRWVWSFQRAADGSLQHGQPFYRLEMLDETLPGAVRSSADGIKTDTLGFLYVTSNLGVQICDQPGRVNAILKKPEGRTPSNVVFGGPNFDTLYVTARDRVYKRPMKRKGSVSWERVKPPVPGL
jgi:gluconolactonase